MLYSNVAAGQTRVLRLMIGMFGLGVMATFVPGVAHTVFGGGHDLRPSNVYAIAYVATRIYGSLSWRRGEVLLDFPVVQYSVGLLPWIVSIWVDEPWKLALWTVGVGIDLLLVLVASGSKILEQVQTKISAQASPRRRTGRDGRPERAAPIVQGVSVGSGSPLRTTRTLRHHRPRRKGDPTTNPTRNQRTLVPRGVCPNRNGARFTRPAGGVTCQLSWGLRAHVVYRSRRVAIRPGAVRRRALKITKPGPAAASGRQAEVSRPGRYQVGLPLLCAGERPGPLG